MPSRKELANAIRALSMDAVQRARSGHPGMPMGMADIAEVLWNDFLVHAPNHPNWLNRDRFILSNGHGSLLQYTLLHLTGYALTINDLKNFRQLHAPTPGHPEYGLTPGVETTTGPLGQGFANAVGMAIAERRLGAEFNHDDLSIIDHYTYVFVGDGCLMEGISHEVASLAGTLKLGKLITIYDDNHISIDGDTAGWFTDDTPKRFEAYHWHVVREVDGHDPEAIKHAIKEARAVTDQPSLICCRTVIGYGAPNKQGQASTHGAPLGEEEIAAARQTLDWPYAPFEIPKTIYNAWNAQEAGEQAYTSWQKRYQQYAQRYPDHAEELTRRLAGKLPEDWKTTCHRHTKQLMEAPQDIATRKASTLFLNQCASKLPELFGGSADLTGSNNTDWKGMLLFTADQPKGQYLHFGVREFGMFAIMNGISLYGGFLPYSGTFLVFSDYGRNAIRLAALMKQRVIFVLTHDSIGLGEDGPTHQPIEHIAMLRATPDLTVWRPADTIEAITAWQCAVEHSGPSALLMSRQTLPHLSHTTKSASMIKRGGYIALDCQGTPEAIIIATGSEVCLAIEAARTLNQQGEQVRVVSMPSVEVFERQNEAYRTSVLPDQVNARVAVEAAAGDFWHKYVGRKGRIIGLNTFGLSAPYKAVFNELGLTVAQVKAAVLGLTRKKEVHL